MPKIVLYGGQCRSITQFGYKFTQESRRKILTDKDAEKFVGVEDFKVYDIPKSEVIPEKDSKQTKDSKQAEDSKKEDPKQSEDQDLIETDESKRSKLSSLTLERLKEMCELKGLKTSGTKSELIERLLAPQE